MAANQKHKLHDAIEKHITDCAAQYGVTFKKHELDEALRIEQVKGSLEQAVSGDNSIVRLREAIAYFYGFASFMQSQGANDPLVGRTIASMKDLLT